MRVVVPTQQLAVEAERIAVFILADLIRGGTDVDAALERLPIVDVEPGAEAR